MNRLDEVQRVNKYSNCKAYVTVGDETYLVYLDSCRDDRGMIELSINSVYDEDLSELDCYVDRDLWEQVQLQLYEYPYTCDVETNYVPEYLR